MSTSDSEASQIYPHLNSTAPQESQIYQLWTLNKVEAYLLDEIEVREGWRLTKKMKGFNAIKGVLDTGLLTSAVVTGVLFTAGFEVGAGLPLGVAVSWTTLLFSLATAITLKYFKIFTMQHETKKHDASKLFDQRKGDRIINIISKAMQDGDISIIKFFKVLLEVEKDCKFKTDIRN